MESGTDKEKSVSPQSNSFYIMLYQSHRRSFFVAQSMLRALALVSSIVSLSVLVTSGVSAMVYGIRFEAHYSYSAAYRFLMGADSVVCGFSALSLVFLYLLSRIESNIKNYFLLLFHDLVIMMLAISGCSAASAVGYVARYGEQRMGWFPVCDQVPSFCNRVLISLILSYLSFFCYLALTLSSANKLVSVASLCH